MIAVVVHRLRQRGHAIPSLYPWAFAIWGAARLLNFTATLAPEETGLVLVVLSTLLTMVGSAGLVVGLRELRRDRAP